MTALLAGVVAPLVAISLIAVVWVLVSGSPVLEVPFAGVWVPLIAALWGVAFVVAAGYLGYCLRERRWQRLANLDVARWSQSDAGRATGVLAGVILFAAAFSVLALFG